MNEIETRILEAIGESITSPDVFDDDGIIEIRDMVNDAIQEICLVTGSKRRQYIIPLEANKNFYRVRSATDLFGWPVSIWLVNQKRRLEHKSIKWIIGNHPTFLKTTATPIRYCFIGHDVIMLDPTPSSDSDSIMIDAVSIPARYTTDTDPIKIRQSFKHAIVQYAISEFWASRGDAKTAGDALQRYVAHLGITGIYPETYERRWGFQTQ